MRELRAAFADVDEVQEALQLAIELEMATIPPYLYALWSIKDRRSRAAELIMSVIAEEMLHIALAGNILNAIGGRPRIDVPDVVPTYPAALPGGVQPDLVVGLRRCDVYQLEVFKKIEIPEKPVDIQFLADARGPVTIGQFYDGIARALEDLGPPAFHGDPGRQLRRWPTSGGLLRPVDDPASAQSAIRLIKEQGEGASEHDPTERDGELGHYYLFWEIIEGREIILRGDTWAFAGADIPPPDLIPLTDNPKAADLAEGSMPWLVTRDFNAAYRRLLRALDRAFDGEPDRLDDAMGLMYSLRVLALDVMKHAAPASVGVLGPTFEYLADETA